MLLYHPDNSTTDHRASAALSHYTNNHIMSSPPNHRRGPWSAQEDAYLMSLVQTQGPLNWVRIANHLISRTPKQCRERYHQNLKPSLNHDPITPEEGAIIESMVQQIGKRWADIARRLQGRSDNAVKNWWNGSQNRRKRQDKRKATSLQYHGSQINTATPLMSPMAPVSSRPLPLPQGHGMVSQRPLVPPLHPSAMHDARYGIETPISSPAYSPDSEAAPSLMSDNGSHYGTSPQAPSPPPRYYDSRPESTLLAPLKTASEDGVYSYRATTSPADNNNNNNNNNNNKLPSLTDAAHPLHSPDFSLNMSPVFPRNEYPRQPLAYGAPAPQHNDYFTTRQHHHPLTAPSSPNAPASTFKLSDPGLSANTRAEEKCNRLSVSNLVDPSLP